MIKKYIIIVCFFVLVNTGFANTTLDAFQRVVQQKENKIHASQLRQTNGINPAINSQQATLAQTLSRDYIFILFFQARCPHCQRFAPVLRQFSTDYHIALYSVTLDGGTLQALGDAYPVTPDLITAFFSPEAPAVPALYLMNSHNAHVYPVSVGEMSYVELQNRVKQLGEHIVALEHSP